MNAKFLHERQLFGEPLLYLRGARKKDMDNLFSSVCCGRTEGDGFKVKKVDLDQI